MLTFTKAKSRPIGYVTAGGYIKTAKGWRKAPKGKKQTAKVVVATVAKKKQEIKEETEITGLPDLNKFKQMSIPELRTYAKENFNARMLKIGKGNKEAADAIVYQLEMLKGLGFLNRKKLTIRFDDVVLQADKCKGKYQPSFSRILVSSIYTESFIHEYFHHLYYTKGLDKTRAAQDLVDRIIRTSSYKRFIKKDHERIAEGKKVYYTDHTEMLSRLAEQVVPYLPSKENRSPHSFVYSQPVLYGEYDAKDVAALEDDFVKTFRRGKVLIKSLVFYKGRIL